jgi:hypothetical protein
MERDGRTARAVMDAAEAANWRRVNRLLVGTFFFLFQVFQQMLGSALSSCSRTRPAILYNA